MKKLKQIISFCLAVSVVFSLGAATIPAAAATEDYEVAFSITDTTTDLFDSSSIHDLGEATWADGVSYVPGDGLNVSMYLAAKQNTLWLNNYIFNQNPRYNVYRYVLPKANQGDEYVEQFLFDNDIYKTALKQNPYCSLDFSIFFYYTNDNKYENLYENYRVYALYEDENGTVQRYGDGASVEDNITKVATNVGANKPDGSGSYKLEDYSGAIKGKNWYEVSVPVKELGIDPSKGFKGLQFCLTAKKDTTGSIHAGAYYNIRITTPAASDSSNIVPFTSEKPVINTSVANENISWTYSGTQPLFYSVYDLDGTHITDTTECFADVKNKLLKVYPYYENDGYADGTVVGSFFIAKDLNGVSVSKIEVNGEDAPYSNYKLGAGTADIKVTAEASADKKLKLCALSHSGGLYVAGGMSALKDFAANKAETLDAQLQIADAGEAVSLFLTDENNCISSNIYQLTSDGAFEVAVSGICSIANELKPVFNPVTTNVEFELDAAEASAVCITVKPDDANDLNDYVYAGICSLEKGVNNISVPADTNKFDKSAVFTVTVNGFNADDVKIGTCQYISPSELKAHYATINNPTSSEDEIINVLIDPALSFDLTEYNSLNGVDGGKSKVAALIKEYNVNKDVNSCADIQNLLDAACATVIVSCKPNADAISKYAKLIGLDEKYVQIFDKMTDAQRNETANVMNENKLSASGASNAEAGKIFKDAVVVADIKTAETYGVLMEKCKKTYASEVNIDETSAKNVSLSDVYKYIFNNRDGIIRTSQIQDLFDLGVKTIPSDTDSGKSSGGKGSGGGGGKGTYYTDANPTVTPPSEDITRKIFTDIPDGHWALASVEKLSKIGIISESAQYRPDDFVTREEIVKMLVCAFGQLDKDAVCDFSDVNSDDWFYPYVSSAVAENIVQGMGDGRFGSGTEVSRQDAAVMVYRCAKEFLSEVHLEYTNSFADSGSVSEYAADAVNSLSYNKVINGYEDLTFRPFGKITRAECAQIIATLIGRN